MPIYTLRCAVCNHVFEELLSMTADNPSCPYVPEGTGPDGEGAMAPCGCSTVRIPSQVSRPQGGDTPIHFRNRRENR